MAKQIPGINTLKSAASGAIRDSIIADIITAANAGKFDIELPIVPSGFITEIKASGYGVTVNTGTWTIYWYSAADDTGKTQQDKNKIK